MRSYFQMDFLVSNDVDQTERIVQQLGVGFDDSDAVRNEVCAVQRITLAPAAVDQIVNFGSVTAASSLLVVAYNDITMKLNGSAISLEVNTTPARADGIVLSQLQKSSQPGIAFLRSSITQITLSNASITSSAGVLVVLVGNQS